MLKYIVTFLILLIAVSAIGYLFFPSNMLSVVGVVSNPQMDFLARTLGAALVALIPGLWVARNELESPVARAVLLGLVIYLFLGSLVDFYAYTQALVNSISLPSIAVRVLLGFVILWFMRKKRA
ncbi:MAG: hypothetical protein EYC68_11400 [Chloroflexota bacterium]|nr:MAG: hypothetical protein EYC68_11400 [Chloroflexota bacterium]